MYIYSNRETSFLKNNMYYDLAQELIYQWLGSWITPEWWSEAHLNKALARFIASDIVKNVITLPFLSLVFIDTISFLCR